MSCFPGGCDFDECTNYSDVDVYYDDGTSSDRCSKHAMSGDKSVVQVVPQHGSDEVNRPMPSSERR